MSRNIIDWGLRDINEMLGVNKFLDIDADTDEYLEDFLKAVAKVNLEEMIITIAKDYRVKNWRHPVSSSMVVMNALANGTGAYRNNKFLNEHQRRVLSNMGTVYSLGGYSLCMEDEKEKGLQVILSFPKLYSDFMKTMLDTEGVILNHTDIIQSIK